MSPLVRLCSVCREPLGRDAYESRWMPGEFRCPVSEWIACDERGRRRRLEAAAAASKVLAAIHRAQKQAVA